MMFDRFDNRVTLRGSLVAETGLRIGASRSTGVTGSDLPVVRDALGKPYIPGSSFKGALRAYIESLVRSVYPSQKGACNPLNPAEWCLPNEEAKKLDDAAIIEQTCLVCGVFGSPWLASKISIRDLHVDRAIWFDQFEVRNGVAIDRDTETASDGKLYDFEVLPAGTRFECEVVIENAREWELGLVMLGLRAFETGDLALGGARSRGLGVVRLNWDSFLKIDGDGLLDYLAGDEADRKAFSDESVKDQIKQWIGAAKTHIREAAGAAEAKTDA